MALNSCYFTVPDWLPLTGDATWMWFNGIAFAVIITLWGLCRWENAGPVATWARSKYGLWTLSIGFTAYLVYVYFFLAHCYADGEGYHSKHVLAEALVVTGFFIFACMHGWNAMNNAWSVSVFCVVWVAWSVLFAGIERDPALFAASGSIVTVGGVMLGLPNRSGKDERARQTCALILTVVGTMLWGYGDRLWSTFIG